MQHYTHGCKHILILRKFKEGHFLSSGSPTHQLSAKHASLKNMVGLSVKQKMLRCAPHYLKESMKRVDQARRSVLILKVNNCSRIIENLCKEYGQVEHMEIITSSQKSLKQMALVEFAEEESVKEMVGSCIPSSERRCFKSGFSRITSFQRPRHVDNRQTSSTGSQSTQKSLSAQLRGSATLGDCVRVVREATELSDTALRCNYLQCRLIDDLMSYYMPETVTLPHGSVLSGLATVHSDLDMVLHPLGLVNYNIPRKEIKVTGKFQASSSLAVATDRADDFDVDMINHVAFALRYFGKAFCREVIPLPQAKHPIVRFKSILGFGNCDLTVHLYRANEGVLSSCMLQMICDNFPDFQSLSHCLRFWAMRWELTSSKPGKYLINFTLTHLLIYYLQEMKLLPSIQDLSSPDAKVKSLSSKDSDSLGELYKDFFLFYSTFDYNRVIDVTEARLLSRTDMPFPLEFEDAPMAILNTLDSTRNIAVRMSEEYLQKFVKYSTDTHATLSGSKSQLGSFRNSHRM